MTLRPSSSPSAQWPGHRAGGGAVGRKRLPRPVRRPDHRHRHSRRGDFHGRAAPAGRWLHPENNIVQTGASAGSSIAAGVIFTIPALVIMGYWPDFKYWWVLGIAGLGGLLGVLFSVPLRRSMIVEDPLPFPEGKAAAEVLKAGENRPGPEDPRPVGGDRRLRQAGRGKRDAPDSRCLGHLGLCRQLQGHRLHRYQPVTGVAGRGLHRRPQRRHRGGVRFDPDRTSPSRSTGRSS